MSSSGVPSPDEVTIMEVSPASVRRRSSGSLSSISSSISLSSLSSSGSTFSASPHILQQREHQRGSSIGTFGGQPVYVMPVGVAPQQDIKTLQPRQLSPMESQMNGSVQVQPRILVLEEPEDKFRFRYKSEMQGTHGCIHGKTYNKKNKKFPMIQVVNVPPDVEKVRVRVALYTNEPHGPKSHHVHKLMWKAASDSEQDFVESDLTAAQLFTHVWQGLGIIHTGRKYIDQVLYDRIKKVFIEKRGAIHNMVSPPLSDADMIKLKKDAHEMGAKIVDKLNTVVLGFEAFRVDNGIYRPICPMAFSYPINNLKNPSTGDLKISRISAFAGSVNGGEEVFIFIERVKKGDIKVRFFELDKDEERVWSEFAEFQENDVHHQYAVAFKTPAYPDTSVEKDVHVFFELYRPSDEAISEPKAFRYKPSEDSRIRGKRRRLDPTSFMNRTTHLGDIDMSPYTSESSMIPVTVEETAPSNINLSSIIDTLLTNPDYVSTLNNQSMSTYDHLKTDIVPDLLVFSKPFQQGLYPDRVYPEMKSPINVGDRITVDSAPLEDEIKMEADVAAPVPSDQEDLSTAVAMSLSQALNQFAASSNKEVVFEKIYHLLGVTTADGDNTLHMAVLNKQEEALRFILDVSHKMNFTEILNEKNVDGNSPLHLAVLTRQSSLVRLLIQYNANPNVVDCDGNTPIHICVRHGLMDILAVLLNDQADLNMANNAGLFPIHLAVKWGCVKSLWVLTEHGVDVDAQDKVSGRTALYMATEEDKKDIIEYLVNEAKADVTSKSFNGTSSMDVATNEEAIRILKNKSVSSKTSKISKSAKTSVNAHKTVQSVQELNDFEFENLKRNLSENNNWERVAANLGLGSLIAIIREQEQPESFFIQYLKTKQMKMDLVEEAFSKIILNN